MLAASLLACGNATSVGAAPDADTAGDADDGGIPPCANIPGPYALTLTKTSSPGCQPNADPTVWKWTMVLEPGPGGLEQCLALCSGDSLRSCQGDCYADLNSPDESAVCHWGRIEREDDAGQWSCSRLVIYPCVSADVTMNPFPQELDLVIEDEGGTISGTSYQGCTNYKVTGSLVPDAG